MFICDMQKLVTERNWRLKNTNTPLLTFDELIAYFFVYNGRWDNTLPEDNKHHLSTFKPFTSK